jgi:hypothetical protein
MQIDEKIHNTLARLMQRRTLGEETFKCEKRHERGIRQFKWIKSHAREMKRDARSMQRSKSDQRMQN